MQQVTVNTPSGHYAVVCGRGTLARTGALVSALRDPTGVFILSSPRVWKLWGKKLESSFHNFGGARKILFNDGERAKTLATVGQLCRALARMGADRRAIVVALGGGVVGDVAGFVAACYDRGICLVQVPTTLLAQVDSAIGGKTGVNLPEGKNLVGAFHQPRLVVVDPDALRTLPARQFRSGLYEVIKYAVIGDEQLFRFLERRLGRLLRRDRAALAWVLPRCIRAKARVVSADEREMRRGGRQILNFGHTFGHALEAVTRYRKFLHGEAVGWGMIAAAELAVATNRFPASEAARLVRLVAQVGSLPALPRIAAARLLRAMETDKKSHGGRLHFVLPRRIGEVEVVGDVPEAAIAKVWLALRRLPAALGRGGPPFPPAQR